MPYIGFARSPHGPRKTYEMILGELGRRGFEVGFSKHHWAGDLPFELVVAGTQKGATAVRWSLGKEFSFRLEAVDGATFDEFVEDTVEYTDADSG